MNYQLLIYEDVEKKGQKRKAVDFFTVDGTREDGQHPRRLCLWCFSCSVAMKDLQKHEVHSVIITSGTLSPMNSTAEAFGVPFPVILENRHVIDPSRQLFGALLSQGPNEVSLDAAFSHRSDVGYIKELGATVKRLAGSVPDGLLLAFSSYSMKDSILEAWRQQGILQDISTEKPVFEEPKGNHETKQMMEKYNGALAGSAGAILAAVCRGKLCEGIDFTDKQCRMVVMVGIPYPAKNDLRVILKQDFLNLQAQGQGQCWYHREAMRAVNQTLGRVIRHRKDYGAVILCDARFSRSLSGLSSWLRPQVCPMTLEAALQDCRRFFGRPILLREADQGAQQPLILEIDINTPCFGRSIIQQNCDQNMATGGNAPSGIPLQEYPPGWQPGLPDYPLRLYMDRVKVWYRLYDGPDETVGPLLAGRLGGRAQKIALTLRLANPLGHIDVEDAALVRLSVDEVRDPNDPTIVIQHHIISGVQALFNELRAAFGEGDQVRATQSLENFFDFRRGRLSLAEYSAEWTMRLEEAMTHAGLNINDVARTFLFFRGSQLSQRHVDDILMQIQGDLGRFQDARALPLRLAHRQGVDNSNINYEQADQYYIGEDDWSWSDGTWPEDVSAWYDDYYDYYSDEETLKAMMMATTLKNGKKKPMQIKPMHQLPLTTLVRPLRPARRHSPPEMHLLLGN
eukprot:s753_g24.t1